MSKKSQFFRCKSTERTLKWLENNYELRDDVCLPRCLLYTHYLDYCHSTAMEPISAAAFGKIIRRKFNKITTRRLGTRGQSKYHYFGLSIKKSSNYYGDYLENCQKLRSKLRKVGSRKKVQRNYSTISSETMSKLLGSFPRASDFIRPDNLLFRNIETFLVMYKSHCERLADIIINLQFDSIYLYLKHFWLEIPCNFENLLTSDLTSKVIQCCDYILYEALLFALFPQNFKNISNHLVDYLNKLIINLESWFKEALIGLPDLLIVRKIEALQHFIRPIKRYKCLFPLIKNCSFILNQKELLTVMTSDLRSLDLDNIFEDFLLNSKHHFASSISSLITFFINIQLSLDLDHFFSSLRQLFSIFLDKFRSSCIVTKSTEFILIINRLIVCLCRELTINNVSTLNHWITLFSTVREYSILIGEDRIRTDHFNINKLLITRWDNLCPDQIDFCDY